MTHALAMSPGEAVDRLRPSATLRGEVHIEGERYDDAGALAAAELTWLKGRNRLHTEWDNTALGRWRFDGSRLVVEVNSSRQRRRIEKEIAKRLGSAATLIETTVTDLAKALEVLLADVARMADDVRRGSRRTSQSCAGD